MQFWFDPSPNPNPSYDRRNQGAALRDEKGAAAQGVAGLTASYPYHCAYRTTQARPSFNSDKKETAHEEYSFTRAS